MSEKEILISIVVPAYNVENYIKECIDSILYQSYKNIEVIVVNDGSTDGTLDILKEYTDERLSVYTQKNLGGPAARNYGLEHSSGEYICFFDSDDVMCEDILQLYVDILKEKAPDFIIGSNETISENGEKTGEVTVTIENRMVTGSAKNKCFLCNPLPITKLYKKQIILDNNIRWGNVKIRTRYGILFKICFML